MHTLLDPKRTELKIQKLHDTTPEIPHFYGIVLRTYDKSVNINPSILD